METKRSIIWKIFTSQPHDGFSIQDLSNISGLTNKQVRRAIQFYLGKDIIIPVRDKYTGIGGKGKIVYYTLSHEIYNKLG